MRTKEEYRSIKDISFVDVVAIIIPWCISIPIYNMLDVIMGCFMLILSITGNALLVYLILDSREFKIDIKKKKGYLTVSQADIACMNMSLLIPFFISWYLTKLIEYTLDYYLAYGCIIVAFLYGILLVLMYKDYILYPYKFKGEENG